MGMVTPHWAITTLLFHRGEGNVQTAAHVTESLMGPLCRR